jgi:hypothetical protein
MYENYSSLTFITPAPLGTRIWYEILENKGFRPNFVKSRKPNVVMNVAGLHNRQTTKVQRIHNTKKILKWEG